MPFELRIALRYLTARRKQAFISLISGISVIGVSVGVMALLIALGLMTGLQGELRSKILGTTAHLSIFRSGGGLCASWGQAALHLDRSRLRRRRREARSRSSPPRLRVRADQAGG